MNIINIDTKEGYTIFVNELTKLLQLVHNENLKTDPEYKARWEALEKEYDRVFNTTNNK